MCTTNQTTVTLSDLSRSVLVLEDTVANLDKDISKKALEILKLQKEMSDLITQRDSLIQTSHQILNYRKSLYPEF